MSIGLDKDAVAMFDISRGANRVVDAEDYHQGPGDGDQDPVDGKGRWAVGVAFGEGVD